MTSEQEKRWQALGQVVEEQMEAHQVPGVSIGLRQGGETFAGGFGVTSVENPLPVSEDTLFQIGSISKTFTATAVMRLVERGKLSLEAPVRVYFPDFRVVDEETAANVTIRHLLTHTAGWLGDYFIGTGAGDDAVAKYAARMAELEQITALGEAFSYNNASFYLLGHIVELVTGKSYEDALAELVLEPLQLERCFLDPGEVMVNRFATGHRIQDGEAHIARPWPLPRAVYAAGGLVCCVPELLKYATFHLGDGTAPGGERLLTGETMQLMQTPQAKIWGDDETVGLSWFVNFEQGVKIVSHGGGTVGQISRLLFVPGHDFALAVLTNAESGGQLIEAVWKWCRQAYLGIDVADPQPIEAPLEKKQACAGRYVLPRRGYTELGVLGERLIAQDVPTGGFPTEDVPPPPAPPPYTLKFIEENRLLVMDGPFKGAKIDVIRDEAGAIRWLRKGGRLYTRER